MAFRRDLIDLLRQGVPKTPAYWEDAELFDRTYSSKLCLAESDSDPCEGKIVNAHSIPRSQLRQIARDGRVYTPSTRYAGMTNDRESNSLKLIGISQSSTFNCFCSKHDARLFSAIENNPLIFNHQQLALLHYRAFAMELYKKLGSLHHTETTLRKSKIVPHSHPNFLEELRWVTVAGVEVHKSKQMIDLSSFDELSGLVIYFRRMPSIMVVGGIQPEFDFQGTALRNKDTQFPSSVSFNVLAVAGGAAVAIVWLKAHKQALTFVRSLLAKDPARYTTSIIQSAFEFIENICIEPTWWEELHPVVRESLAYRLHFAGGPLLVRQSDCLSFTGVKYDDWIFDRHEVINSNFEYARIVHT